MEPVYYTVGSIDGDYARMTSGSGVENRMAMFLLPEGTTVGGRLVREIFEWSWLDKCEKRLIKPPAASRRRFD